MQAKKIRIAKGRPVTITAVFNASKPPPARSTTAIIPREIAQTTLRIIGGSSCAFSLFAAVNIEVTKAPESEEVTKNVKIITIDRPIKIGEKGNCSKKTNSEIAMSLFIAVLSEFGSNNS